MDIDLHKEDVLKMYRNKSYLKKIGDKYGCNSETVKRRLVEWGEPIRHRGWWSKGKKKTAEHRAKLRKHLDKIRSLAIAASKIKNRERYKDNNNPKWKGGISDSYFKQKVLAKYGRICNYCGYKDHPEIIEVHHKDGNHKNLNIENGISLCPNCHRIEHFKLKTFHTKLKK